MVDLKRSGVELHGISFLLKRPVTKSNVLTNSNANGKQQKATGH